MSGGHTFPSFPTQPVAQPEAGEQLAVMYSSVLPSPEAPHGSSVSDGLFLECIGEEPCQPPGPEEHVLLWGSSLLPRKVRRKIILRFFLIYFNQFVLQTWPWCPGQLDSCRKTLRTSATTCNVGSWVWVGPVTASVNLSTLVLRVRGQNPARAYQEHPHCGMRAGPPLVGTQQPQH